METQAVNRQIEELTRQAVRADSRLMLLDFDGTLVDFTPDPVSTEAPGELLELLRKLASKQSNKLIIISGRKQDEIDRLVGVLPIDILAEHGAFIRENRRWRKLLDGTIGWKEYVRPLMERFRDLTPGSFIEEKKYSLAWHYRNTRPETGEANARLLTEEIRNIVSRQRIKILNGKKIVEAIAENITKGMATRYLVSRNSYDYILAIGDDTTDEDMFRSLLENSRAYTVKIGPGRTSARYKLKGISHVIQLLNKLEAAL